MDFLIPSAWAQAAPAAAQPSPMFTMLMMLALIAVFWFLAIRPQMKRAKEHRAMVQALAKGDEVLAAGGLLGRVEEIGEAFVAVQIADGVTVRVQKGAIAAVLPKGTLKSL